jgi:hypothetical protein
VREVKAFKRGHCSGASPIKGFQIIILSLNVRGLGSASKKITQARLVEVKNHDVFYTPRDDGGKEKSSGGSRQTV